MRVFFLNTTLLLTLLVGCSSESVKHHYYLLLMGESENWYVKDYEIEFNPETYRAGNGMVFWKGDDALETDSFQVSAYASINEEDHIIHSTSFSGTSTIKEHATGGIEGEFLNSKEDHSISLDDIENIYIVIEWWDQDQKKNVSEQINMYQNES